MVMLSLIALAVISGSRCDLLITFGFMRFVRMRRRFFICITKEVGLILGWNKLVDRGCGEISFQLLII